MCTGEGLMPKGGWFRFDDLKLRLETCNGSAVLFDSTKMLHSTEECEPAEGGQAQRMGVSLQCRKPVSFPDLHILLPHCKYLMM